MKIPRPEGDAARYLEIRAELKIGGAVEAARDVNDVWDVPYAPLERKLEWLFEAPDGHEDAQLIVRKESNEIALARPLERGSSSTLQCFDLTNLAVDCGYTLELHAAGMTLAPLLTLDLQSFETSLLLGDLPGVARSLIPSASVPVPEALTGSEQHLPADDEPELIPEPRPEC